MLKKSIILVTALCLAGNAQASQEKTKSILVETTTNYSNDNNGQVSYKKINSYVNINLETGYSYNGKKEIQSYTSEEKHAGFDKNSNVNDFINELKKENKDYTKVEKVKPEIKYPKKVKLSNAIYYERQNDKIIYKEYPRTCTIENKNKYNLSKDFDNPIKEYTLSKNGSYTQAGFNKTNNETSENIQKEITNKIKKQLNVADPFIYTELLPFKQVCINFFKYICSNKTKSGSNKIFDFGFILKYEFPSLIINKKTSNNFYKYTKKSNHNIIKNNLFYKNKKRNISLKYRLFHFYKVESPAPSKFIKIKSYFKSKPLLTSTLAAVTLSSTALIGKYLWEKFKRKSNK